MNFTEMRQLIDTLPRFDLHFHFEGAIPWHTIRELHPAGNSLPLTPPWYKEPIFFPEFTSFLEVFNDYIRPCLQTVDNYITCARSIRAWLEELKMDYVEWNISVKPIVTNGLAVQDVFREIEQYLRSTWKPGLPIIRLFAGINREYSLDEKKEFLSQLKNIHGLMGIDLHGYENPRDLIDVRDFITESQDVFKKVKVHAGELGDADNVRIAIEELGIRHICHGIQSINDPELLQTVAGTDVIFELSSSSNLAIGVVPHTETYPFRTFIDNNIKFALNTDDPMIFNCSLLDEYYRAAEAGIALHEIVRIVLNGIEASTLTPFQKGAYQKKALDLLL